MKTQKQMNEINENRLAEFVLRSPQPPWADLAKFESLCAEHGVIVEIGENYNRTDGEVHFILRRENQTHELTTNYWDCRLPAWQRALDWIYSAKE